MNHTSPLLFYKNTPPVLPRSTLRGRRGENLESHFTDVEIKAQKISHLLTNESEMGLDSNYSLLTQQT